MRPLLPVAILLLLISRTGFAQKDMKAPIMAANQLFMNTFSKGATNMGDLYTTDGQLLFANQAIIQGPQAISAFWKNVYDSGVKRMKLETIDAKQEGNVIIEEGRFASYDATDKQLDMGKYIVIWKQEKRQWKLHRDIGNTSMPVK